MPVAPAAHLGEERLLGPAYDLRLFREQVAEPGDAAELRRGGGSRARTTVGEETSGRRPRRACQRSFVFVVLVVVAVRVGVLAEVKGLGVVLDRVHAVLDLLALRRTLDER